jgi:hypothetical protein
MQADCRSAGRAAGNDAAFPVAGIEAVAGQHVFAPVRRKRFGELHGIHHGSLV